MNAQAISGDAGAALAHALFERHHAEVYAYLCRLLRDGEWAEDLTQETFLRAFKARATLAQVENQRAWLYRVATNLALNALKRRRRFAWLPWSEWGERRAARQDVAGTVARRSALEAALAALPADLRAPLLLYAGEGLSVAEVAQALALSEGAVKMRLLRARRLFRVAYEREDGR